MIGRDRRDAAPVVEPRIDQLLIDARRQIWRRLDIHVGPENQTRRRDGPQQVVEIGFLGIGELGFGFGPEVLDDDFLDVAIGGMQIPNRLLQFAGQTQGLQPDCRMFVGRTVVNAALPAEPLAGGLQHDALTGRHLAQAGDLLARHNAGIGMRQQPGLAQHERAHRGQIGNRRFVTERLQRVARGLVS